MLTIDAGTTQLRYTFEGPANAPVLVLSNSLGTDVSMWQAQLPAFNRPFRVLRYDTRGHGGSTPTAGPYTIEQLGGDVLGMLDALGLERVSFCGLSMGGMIGMWLAAHAPERVERLALCNTAARIGPAERWNARIDMVEQGGLEAIATAVLGGWFTPAFAARAPREMQRMRDMLVATLAAGYIACCAAVRDADLRATLPQIRAPTLVISGSHDVATPPADGRLLSEHIAEARYVELPAAHLSNIEAAEDFNAAVMTFMSGGEVGNG